ncbi:DUF3078 domain-containing protein [Dyadobacter frigoris]|uniref:DUF3078 domain-containing protein n=1 Tax=Dyadobacter frigoris TaxID=2576211 RepID=A0A4U6D947_9BACT|nr:DUF3078 domain-containing protein [Dyadobacter frigoris]TKT90744.1 DUF3078 domain-containing protein [Dyadobacter frigoris]
MNYFSALFLNSSKRNFKVGIIFFLFPLCFNPVKGQAPYDFSKLIDLSNGLNAARLKVEKDTSWHKMELGANFNQGSFSPQWTGGGVSSIGIGVLFNALFEKKKGKNSWRNDLQTQYGFAKNEGQGSRKNMDRIFFDTKYNRDVSSKCALFANINFQSQFAGGFDYSLNADSVMIKRKVSRFAAPAYFTQSIGMEYKPVDYFFLDFAPGAFRQTFVWDKNLYVNTPNQNNYGVAIGRRIHYELALMQIVANYNKDIAKQMNLKFRYQLYSSLADPSKIDSRLDASLTAKLNKYMNVNLSAILVYNEDQSANIQLAQGLNIGFLYSF